jgi:hypothetical protein
MTTVAPAPDDLAELDTDLDYTTWTIYRLLMEAKRRVGAVGKLGHNVKQNYDFRGIDDVVNTVSPVFAELGILILPQLATAQTRDIVSTSGSKMREVTLSVGYRFQGPIDFLDVIVPGEAMDSGDKSTPKAMSVALRIALLQALLIPTRELHEEPDSQSYERADVKTEERVRQHDQRAAAPRDTHADLLSVIEQVRVLRGEDEETSNGRVAKYCRERLGTDVVKTAVEGGPIEAIEIRRLSVENAAIMRNAIKRSIREIEESRMATKQEV